MSMKYDPAQLAFWLGAMSEEALSAEEGTSNKQINIAEVERTDDLFELHVELPNGEQLGMISTEGGDAALSATLISILYTLGYEVGVYRN